MTILEALNWGKQQLQNIGNAKTNPMLDAQILLAYCLKKPNAYIFAHFEDILKNDIIDQYQRFITRRKRDEPVSQIIGQKEFYGYNFIVTPNVLTPRPETELLIEKALKSITPQSTIIDVGTGSGAIAITLALETSLPIIAIDIDPQALAVAKHNAIKHKVNNLVTFLSGSLLEPILQKQILIANNEEIVIVANLPYLSINQWLNLNNNVKHYEPKRALVGGVDGLDFYDILLQQTKTNGIIFSKKITLLFEIDPSQFSSIKNLILEYFPTAKIEIKKDLSNRDRIVIAKLAT